KKMSDDLTWLWILLGVLGGIIVLVVVFVLIYRSYYAGPAISAFPPMPLPAPTTEVVELAPLATTATTTVVENPLAAENAALRARNAALSSQLDVTETDLEASLEDRDKLKADTARHGFTNNLT